MIPESDPRVREAQEWLRSIGNRQVIRDLLAEVVSLTARIEQLENGLTGIEQDMRTTAAAMKREADEQRWDRERKAYCDGKEMALRHAADKLSALRAAQGK